MFYNDSIEAYEDSEERVAWLSAELDRLRQKLADNEHIINCAKEVIGGYEFKLGVTLDGSRRVVHHTNSGALSQLDRALLLLGEEE